MLVLGGAVTIWIVAALAPGLQPRPVILTEEQKTQVEALVAGVLAMEQVSLELARAPSPYVAFVYFAESPEIAAQTYCRPDYWAIWVNELLAAQNWNAFLDDTLPHEIGHILVCQIDESQFDGHSELWYTIMRHMGYEPNERHSYRY